MKHLLDIKSLSPEEIENLMDKAKSFKRLVLNKEKLDILKGYRLVNLFFEPSTRTRTSFEIAARSLGIETITVQTSVSSIQKGESLYDTIKTLLSMKIDFVVIRHRYAGAPHFVAKNFNVSVINAGDGYNAHPTQALLDLFTVREKFGSNLKGLKVLIVGDISYSRVARSNMFLFQKLGAEVVVCGPSTLIPRDIEKLGVRVSYNFVEELKDADVINMLRMQFERQTESFIPSIKEYRDMFSLTYDKIRYIKKGAMLIHPGPVNRGIELDDNIPDLDFSYITEQVTNGVAIRMAILHTIGETL